jgi:hypothetical protein
MHMQVRLAAYAALSNRRLDFPKHGRIAGLPHAAGTLVQMFKMVFSVDVKNVNFSFEQSFWLCNRSNLVLVAKQMYGNALLRGYRELWSESRLRFIASWTGMYTDPTAWPLHENTMLEGAMADSTGVALSMNPVKGSRIERLSCAERSKRLGIRLDRSRTVFALTHECCVWWWSARGRRRRAFLHDPRPHRAGCTARLFTPVHIC